MPQIARLHQFAQFFNFIFEKDKILVMPLEGYRLVLDTRIALLDLWLVGKRQELHSVTHHIGVRCLDLTLDLSIMH